METNANSKSDRQQELILIEQTSVTQVSDVWLRFILEEKAAGEKPGLPDWRSLDNMPAMHILRKMEALTLDWARSNHPHRPPIMR